jgi:hypothetical protein
VDGHWAFCPAEKPDNTIDRLLYASLVTIIRLETLLRWHRASFRRYWNWNGSAEDGRRFRRSCGFSTLICRIKGRLVAHLSGLIG